MHICIFISDLNVLHLKHVLSVLFACVKCTTRCDTRGCAPKDQAYCHH